ncbi:MAG: hypothetical protein JNM26_18830 [Ideonella sp.]|nr:hypothetical protein [Ideonella sp.]
MLKTTVSASLAVLAAFTLSACDVRKTQEGDVTLPKYEKTQEGNVTVPKYEVTAPDVKVGTTEKTVTVPKVTTEEKKIEVPTVTVTPAKEK